MTNVIIIVHDQKVFFADITVRGHFRNISYGNEAYAHTIYLCRRPSY